MRGVGGGAKVGPRTAGRLLRRAAVLFLITVSSIPLVTPAHVAAVTTTTGVFLDGEATEWVSRGDQWVLVPPDHVMTSPLLHPDHDSAGFAVDGGAWILQFSAPTGETLAPGATYETSSGYLIPGQGAMSVGGDGRGCSRAVGAFTVHQIEYLGNGYVSAFDADFWQRCDDGRNATLYGSIRWNSTRKLKAPAVDPDIVDLGKPMVGTRSEGARITIANGGSDVIQFGSKTFTGSAADEFEIVNDTCQAIVQVGTDCHIDVAITPSVRGPRTATLTIADSTYRGKRVIALGAAAVIPTVTTLALGDQAGTYLWTTRFNATVDPNPGGGAVRFTWMVGTDAHQETIDVNATTGVAEGLLDLPPGSYQVGASFKGFDYYEPSSAAAVSTDVQMATTTTLVAEVNPIAEAAQAHLVATTTGPWGFALPAGTLTIYDDSDQVVATKAVGGSVRTMDVWVCCLPLGDHAFRARYEGSPYGGPSEGQLTQIVADVSPPLTQLLSYPLGWQTATTEAITWLIRYDGVASQCRLDAGEWATCTSPHTLTNLAQGPHDFEVRSVDAAGNWEPFPATANWIIDHQGPDGSVVINDGAIYTKSRWVLVHAAATDNLASVNNLTIGNELAYDSIGRLAGWGFVPTNIATDRYGVDLATSGGDGVKSIYVQWYDGALANPSVIRSDTIILDTTAPTVTAPIRRLLPGTAISAGRVSVRLTWAGADTTSGIARYELQQRTDAGSWSTVSANLTTTSIDRWLPAQHVYAFRVRAIDKAGNIGAWASGPGGWLSRFNETTSSITYAGTWRQTSSSVFWNGGAKMSSRSGSKATFTFTGRSVAFVSRLGPTKGKARVYVDGTLTAIVDLYSSTYRSQRIVWARNFASSGRHTVTVVVVGTTGRPRIDLDAFVVGA